MQLLARDPADRPASALEVAERFQKLQQMDVSPPRKQGVDCPPPSPAEHQPVPRRMPRKRWLVAAAALLLLASGGILLPQIIIRIKGPDGKETEITAPGGSKVAIEEKGRVKIDLPASKEKLADPIHPLALVQVPASCLVTGWEVPGGGNHRGNSLAIKAQFDRSSDHPQGLPRNPQADMVPGRLAIGGRLG
jgi:hypothetical protein